MIFISESGLTDTRRAAQWDEWYLEHLAVMTTVPGILSAQRFATAEPGHPPSLAMYTLTSPAVFEDPYYLSVRGMGPWLPLIDRTYYRRNLFDGLEAAPTVASDQYLRVADCAQPDTAWQPGDRGYCLRAVGLDRSTPYRMLEVLDEEPPRLLPGSGRGALYRPVTRRYTGAAT